MTALKTLKHLETDFKIAFSRYKKCLEDKRNIKNEYDFFFAYFKKDFASLEKYLKVLEIIKEKCYLHFTDDITEEEFRLVKEWNWKNEIH